MKRFDYLNLVSDGLALTLISEYTMIVASRCLGFKFIDMSDIKLLERRRSVRSQLYISGELIFRMS